MDHLDYGSEGRREEQSQRGKRQYQGKGQLISKRAVVEEGMIYVFPT